MVGEGVKEDVLWLLGSSGKLRSVAFLEGKARATATMSFAITCLQMSYQYAPGRWSSRVER